MDANDVRKEPEFYQLGCQEAVKRLDAAEGGLTAGEAKKRLATYGPNALAEGPRKSLFVVFLEQFKDFLVLILLASALINGLMGDISSSVVILVVITMNAILSTVQHYKSEQSLKSLKALSAPTAKVMRDGNVHIIPSADVVPGDILCLDAGDYICADGRILECASLKVDESALTGESVPVEKNIAALEGVLPLGDRLNMVYSGCYVSYGRAHVLVTGTGMQTEIGKIAALLKSTQEKLTPLQVSLDDFGRKLSIAIIVICAVLFGLSVFRGQSIPDAFLFAVALAVAAIPEALSSIVTIVLSMGTQKLAKENAIVRKLQAVEGLGSISVICSDKTGTLTQNKMQVQKVCCGLDIHDRQDKPDEELTYLIRAAVLCSDATIQDGQEVGDPTEVALVAYAGLHGLSDTTLRTEYPRLAELPFDSDRKLMSTVHDMDGVCKMYTKGATDILLPRIRTIRTPDGVRPFTEEDAAFLRQANHDFSNEGLRVLAICERTIRPEEVTLEAETDFCFLGLISMQDPPRPEAKEAVAKCKAAGIRPVMITGDHLITASAIARQIGILEEGQEAVEGSMLDAMSDEELKSRVSRISVYARVAPEHKIRIVRAWQDNGYIVAMTGDGVNDAPALRQADTGVAMGITGSDTAKDSASIVLTDDNFATIVKAVENGRNLYANIQKSIQFLLSGNTAGILTVVYASLLALPVPFAAVHLLFINLLTDSLPAIALGVEPHSASVMKDKPRPKNQSILTRHVLFSIGLEGLIIAAATIAAYTYGLQTSPAAAQTMAFATLCLSRLVHGFNCKAPEPVWLSRRTFNNRSLILAFLIGVVLLMAVLLVPGLRSVFSAAALTGSQFAFLIAAAFSNFLVIQLLKTIRSALRKR